MYAGIGRKLATLVNTGLQVCKEIGLGPGQRTPLGSLGRTRLIKTKCHFQPSTESPHFARARINELSCHWSSGPSCWSRELMFLYPWSMDFLAGQANLSAYIARAEALLIGQGNLSSCVTGAVDLLAGQANLSSYVVGPVNLLTSKGELSIGSFCQSSHFYQRNVGITTFSEYLLNSLVAGAANLLAGQVDLSSCIARAANFLENLSSCVAGAAYLLAGQINLSSCVAGVADLFAGQAFVKMEW
ncbi:LOW QUALITY PROTEIN: hypothetical protein Cgig2_032996 [Carnegiea gigantea]|uniref:Uncharacterized protein n=1 Tax=Carnegiea gigantea TaxID=171969 RepID=A0A9Q1JUC8_9CARY|nr:LOW QUALITY PROTEIN: hypothetical protein Cgig2_032996 [Carnegiea gigantea]